MRGKHFKTIGHVLGISPRTVETYVEQMKAKLSAFTRTQLLDMLDESGFGTIETALYINRE